MAPVQITKILEAHRLYLETDRTLGERANFRAVDLAGFSFAGTDLRRVNMRRAVLEGVDLGGADLRRANLIGANLKRARLEKADLSDARLNGANLAAANLKEADLSRADMEFSFLVDAALAKKTKYKDVDTLIPAIYQLWRGVQVTRNGSASVPAEL